MTKVKVYTKNNCPQCDMTKMVLSSNSIEFELINVEQNEEAHDYVVNTLGFRSVPVVEVEGQETFTGFQPDKLQELKQ
ncbi:glutaredoxin-like protein NrdH [Metabacillus fastidiosus]|uniref:glutaredoxin-like protein NrdH n=1 Tax=Metabacillus fastidiosus TaxID=1458 RepID=UPI003D28C78B